MLGFLFRNKKLNNVAHKLFSKIIDQSRLPVFYTDYSVEDSLDGRFDLMALHMSLIINKLDQKLDEPKVSDLKRLLQEAMFDNLDLTLREIGVGDLGVGKKVKVMAEAFYGRIKTYQGILDQNDKARMSEAIHRNLFRQREMPGMAVENVTDYYFRQWQNINEQDLSDIMMGNCKLIDPYEEVGDEQ